MVTPAGVFSCDRHGMIPIMTPQSYDDPRLAKFLSAVIEAVDILRGHFEAIFETIRLLTQAFSEWFNTRVVPVIIATANRDEPPMWTMPLTRRYHRTA